MAFPETVSKRLISVDFIRVVAMLMVIALHTILNFTQRTDFFCNQVVVSSRTFGSYF